MTRNTRHTALQSIRLAVQDARSRHGFRTYGDFQPTRLSMNGPSVENQCNPWFILSFPKLNGTMPGRAAGMPVTSPLCSGEARA